MYISKKIEWIRPYVEEAKKIVPSLKKVTSIKTIRPTKNKLQRTMGLCSTNDGKKYVITLWTHHQHIKTVDPFTCEFTPYSKMDLLVTLAHEIAHLDDFDHSPLHKKIESKLTLLFVKMLEKEGYVSAEHEEKELKASKKKTSKD
jgi:hypothetical protein